MTTDIFETLPIELISQWFLLGFFAVEAAAKVLLNREHQFGIVEDHEVYDKISQDQRGTALATASLVFAGIAIILSDNPSQFVSQIEIFVAGLGLLLTAAFAHELTLTYRIVLTLQEMSLEYGLLFLVHALSLLVNDLVPEASTTMLAVFIIVLCFRFTSVYGELKAHHNE